MSRAQSHKQFTTDTKKKLTKLKKEAAKRDMVPVKSTLNKINLTITKLKTRKSSGVDEIFPDFTDSMNIYFLDLILFYELYNCI